MLLKKWLRPALLVLAITLGAFMLAAASLLFGDHPRLLGTLTLPFRLLISGAGIGLMLALTVILASR
jgi:hypothetical protein